MAKHAKRYAKSPIDARKIERRKRKSNNNKMQNILLIIFIVIFLGSTIFPKASYIVTLISLLA